jgi:cytochrome c biogenesis protein CcmG/thiol:disulfide interchange protein DsbE
MTPASDSPTASARRSMPLWIQILIWLGLIGLLAVLLLGILRSEHPILRVGSKVRDFSLGFYDGYGYQGAGQVHLADLRGKVVLVNFWASWCLPCESEAADLETVWRAYEPGGKVVFLGVDYVDTEPQARVYLQKYAVSYPTGPDLGTLISQNFNRNLGVPETYVIDQQGVLRSIQIGPFQSAADIRATIDPLLAGN